MTLPNCLLIVTAEVDPSVEAEWNLWYDAEHFPDALACPGVLGGRRYVSSGDIGGTERGTPIRSVRRVYTTVYELDGPEALATPEFQKMRGWYRFAPHVRSETKVVEIL